MSISGISSYSNGSYAESIQQRRKEMEAVAAAVQSGDLTGAQQALKTLKTDTQSTQETQGIDALGKARRYISALDLSGSAATSSADTSGGTDGVKDQITSLFSAIEKGDLSGAQTALKTIQANMPQPPPMGPPPEDGSGSSDLSTSLDDLLAAVKSGDTTKAQAALSSIGEGGGLSNDADSGSIGKDLQSIFSNVKSGDMKTAQSSLNTLIEDIQSSSSRPPPPPGMGNGGLHGTRAGTGASAPSDATNSMKSLFDDLSSVFDAVEKGDLTTAQKALDSLKTESASLQSLVQSGTSASSSSMIAGYYDLGS